MGEAYYGRAAAYDRAIAAVDEPALAGALARNVFAGAAAGEAARLAAYVRAAVEALAHQTPESLANGQMLLPDPVSIPAAALHA